MKIGIFLPMEPAGRTAAEHLSDVVDVIREAERMGYSTVWLASRHLSRLYAAIPSPLVLLAAAAAATDRIALGTSAVTLPLEIPLRLAEDFAILDAISEGRARLGVGSGDDPPAFQALGVDYEKRAELFSNALPDFLEILAGRDVAGLQLYPEIENSLSKTALAAQSERGARYAGSLKIGLLQGRTEPGRPGPVESQAAAARAYRDEFPEGWIVTARNAWIGTPRDPELISGLRRHGHYLETRGRADIPDDPEEACEVLNIIWGTADEVAEKTRESVRPIAPQELAITVDPGGLPGADVIARLEKLAASFGL